MTTDHSVGLAQEVRVNGTRISEAKIAREMQNHPAPTANLAWQEAALALAVREVLLQEAHLLGIEPEPLELDSKWETKEEALLRQVIDQEVAVPIPDCESCRRYFDANRGRFTSPALYEACHILISANPEDQDAYEAATAKAEDLLAVLEGAPERFAELARDFSDCSSNENGGSLGQVAQGQTVPEFETFLVNLEEGQLCPLPVRTRYGAHILRLDRKIEGQPLPFEAVQERIALFLSEQSWCRAVHQYISILLGRAQIEGLDLEGAQSPLVQ